MATKNKVILIILSIVLEVCIIFGAYSIGRFTRYKGTTAIGEDAKLNQEQIGFDLSNTKTEIDLSSVLLNSISSSNLLLMQSYEDLKKTNTAQKEELDKLKAFLEETIVSIDKFNDAMNTADDWEILIQEAKRLEAIEPKYNELKKLFEMETK